MVFSVKSLDHVVVLCRDIERSLRFYRDILGCELVRQLDTPVLYQLQAGDAMIDLKPCSEELATRNMDHFCIRITPFEPEVLLTYLGRNGVPYGKVEQRFGATGFGNSVYIEDPDGNCIELKAD